MSGGPSETAGILSGDRIIKVDNTPLVGGKIENSMVYKALRGKRGTPVQMTILRRGEKEPKVFTVTRDRISTYSVDAVYMVDAKTGYIRVNRFSETTYEEFKTALGSLKQKGMSQLMLDLRNTNALLFKNAATGAFNMVYRRGDGNIGWVEPRAAG